MFLYVLNAGLTARSGRRAAATSRSERGRPPRRTARRPRSKGPIGRRVSPAERAVTQAYSSDAKGTTTPWSNSPARNWPPR
jgi:hypothetical protein